MIEALAPDSANDALYVSSLPRGSRRTKHLLDAHVLNLSGEVVAKNSIPISQEITGCRVPGESISKLLGSPFRSRMSRDVEVQYAPPLMGQHQEHVQNLETDGWHGEESDGDKWSNVVVQRAGPRMTRCVPITDH